MLFLLVGEGLQIDVASKTDQIQQARSNHRDKEMGLAQEWSILGELAKPIASKSITYGVPFSQLTTKRTQKVLSPTIWG